MAGQPEIKTKAEPTDAGSKHDLCDKLETQHWYFPQVCLLLPVDLLDLFDCCCYVNHPQCSIPKGKEHEEEDEDSLLAATQELPGQHSIFFYQGARQFLSFGKQTHSKEDDLICVSCYPIHKTLGRRRIGRRGPDCADYTSC